MSARALAAQAPHAEAGDRLVVRIFGGEQLLADTISVSQSGTVILPKLGAVAVTGYPMTAIPDSLRARYAVFLRNPTVEIVVLRRIVVNGEVKRPDIYYVDVLTRLPDVIAHAGGLTEFASSKKVTLRRGDQITPIPDWETAKAVVGELRSGDQVYVGRRSWISQNLLAAASTAAVIASIIITLKK